MKKSRKIYFMEQNIHGAWVVYGTAGMKQYYYYTKQEARKKYLEDTGHPIVEERWK